MLATEAGQKIRIARIKKGLTQTELAAKLKVNQSTVGCWEIGLNFPKASNLRKLSKLLDLSIDDLMKVG